MEYIAIVVQIIFSLAVILIPPKDEYLVVFPKTYKKYLSLEIILQVICLVVSIVLAITRKELIWLGWCIAIIAGGLIVIIFSHMGKRKYFRMLQEIITTNDLINNEFGEIRKFILEKYGLVYSIKDIEKIVSEIS